MCPGAEPGEEETYAPVLVRHPLAPPVDILPHPLALQDRGGDQRGRVRAEACGGWVRRCWHTTPQVLQVWGRACVWNRCTPYWLTRMP